MIECPQCGSNIKGFRCRCGYDVRQKPDDGFRHRDKDKDNADLLEDCRTWLTKECITSPGMAEPERQKAMAAYRKKVAHEPPPDPLDWARRLMIRHEDGEYISPLQQRMAQDALGMRP